MNHITQKGWSVHPLITITTEVWGAAMNNPQKKRKKKKIRRSSIRAFMKGISPKHHQISHIINTKQKKLRQPLGYGYSAPINDPTYNTWSPPFEGYKGHHTLTHISIRLV